MKPLFILLEDIALMSPALKTHFGQILRVYFFKKGEFILKEGQINTHAYFLMAGVVRIFHERGGKEVTSWILKEGDIFMSIFSFFEQKPSYENIEALEDCVCIGIDYEKLQETCEQYPEFNKHQIMLLRKYYARSEERKFKLGRQSPDERYAMLMEDESELLQRVSLIILASYLELSERTFKRARSKYSATKKHKR